MAERQREGRGVGVVADWARKYPLAPRWRREELLSLRTVDGVRISAARLPGPGDAPAAVVLVHGFLNSSRSPVVHAFARRLTERVHVIAPDLRGHGRSGGRVTSAPSSRWTWPPPSTPAWAASPRSATPG
jgi:pimeloyl-ACP methyl ester carboxylesterase